MIIRYGGNNIEKKMYVVRTSDGMYWCGTNYFDSQLRKAKIYYYLKYAQEILDRFPERHPEIIEVALTVVEKVKPCDCLHKECGKTVCYGTKEREQCSCGGDKSKCNFYSEYRK